ncbi:Glu/Leu/Phe/Val dehydrogenase [Candidatus Bealeia paramacronuclearis]|uniref:Glu/Leu/Phe/Val dehydrogenase n=1 Tax=Candidatus Bealeia paramacronuclearis TaxID=1921001 RepID=A0ABZ2C3T5_9PROT|nr:Glu/Leu/Phe/Val dehydrogenase [Candidatus Bealeia paramacronuclearis]
MTVFYARDFDNHENVVFCNDEETGLKAIIAIHNTNRGPALGGCRMWNYVDEQEAVTDALRLSRGMTYKAAIANLKLGGGKAVIIGNSKRDKSPELFRAFGRFVERLGGDYITAEDVGTSVQDMSYIHDTTSHVVGLDLSIQGGSGDPSPLTALGVFQSIKAAVAYKLEQSSLEGVTVAVQGLGHVGQHLCALLKEAGANLIITDIDAESLKICAEKFKAKTVAPHEIYGIQADVFSPCALGAVINDETIPLFKFPIIAGAANNQLARAEHGEIITEKGILYAPDYVVNAGGLISVSYEGPNFDPDVVRRHVEEIHDTLLVIFRKAEERGISTSDAADLLAEERFKRVKSEVSSKKAS